MKFELLTPGHFQRLKPYFAYQQSELCDYSLATILAWSTDEYRPHGAFDGNSLIIAAEYKSFPDHRHLILPIAPPDRFTPLRLQELAIKTGYDKYWLVPESYIQLHGKKEMQQYFTISQQQGSTDYIYRTWDLIQLKGNKYAKKRNLINQFETEYIAKQRTVITPITAENSFRCVDFIEEWCASRNCDGKGDLWFACEKEAAINAIHNIELFDSKGIILLIDGKISALAIASPLTRNMGVLQFEKAFENIKGLYQYFDNQCCRLLLHDFTYVNKESDMNIPGLIQSKKSYHPLRYVKAYELVLKR
jgi:hypothetical protein